MNKGFLTILGIIIGLLVIGGGYYIVSNNISINISPKKDNMIIKVPFIDESGNSESGIKIGCGDKLIYVDKEINTTDNPISVAYQILFESNENQGELTNPIAGQTEERTITSIRGVDVFAPLKFIRAEIVGNTAMVYLEGDLLSNECNDPRIASQIIYTATQFDGVEEVKTFLNGSEFDWNQFGNEKG